MSQVAEEILIDAGREPAIVRETYVLFELAGEARRCEASLALFTRTKTYRLLRFSEP